MISLLFTIFQLFYVPRETTLNYCDIKGNVENPGVYEVKEGEVINDIIKKAGGLKKNSYVKNINLSKKVTDEMVIYILSQSEYEELTYVCPICDCETKEILCDTKENEITSNIQETTTTKVTTTQPVTEEPTTEVIIVNLNTATLEELTKIKGIGESIARNIIEYRKEHVFESIQDLLNVKGVGEKLFEKIKDYITV